MKKTTTYIGIDKIVYEFSRYDIIEALDLKYKLSSQKASKVEIDICEEHRDAESGRLIEPDKVVVTLMFEKEEKR